jgi:hypothetical protein
MSLFPLILAQTGSYCKFNIEAPKCFCLFLPAASAAGRKFEAARSRVVVDYRRRRCDSRPGERFRFPSGAHLFEFIPPLAVKCQAGNIFSRFDPAPVKDFFVSGYEAAMNTDDHRTNTRLNSGQ